ncbi:DUF72 domain-containing protein [Salinispira pacifica]|uniref:DUF72 domain-containing protein n=1 Tax=Salinispira pacifica TaxID=1307761 RepID=V5WKY9_9SPIO|nr:DUF72 domain-containing protein [Salinispira pacifica]AHC16209.1 hypothetical protein L21SP2_2861 [Salinispira pacifica]
MNREAGSFPHGELSLGTCSWKYDGWKGSVYPEKVGGKSADYLQEYARKFSSVEIDQWFWSLFDNNPRLPDPATAGEYAARTPDNFRFTVKLPDSLSLTHHRSRSSIQGSNPYFLSTDLMLQVMNHLSPILPKTRVLMLQFEYLNKKKMPDASRLYELLGSFAHHSLSHPAFASPGGVYLGAEIRNPDYLHPEHFRFLNSRGIVPVLLHGYYMPPVYRTLQEHAGLLDPSRPVVIRLHGPDRKQMDQLSSGRWDRILRPMDEDLDLVLGEVRKLMDRGIHVILNVNNHYEGSAPLTIGKILSRLE